MTRREDAIRRVEERCGAPFSPDVRAFLLAPKAPLAKAGCRTGHDATLLGLLRFERMRAVSDRRGHTMVGLFDNDAQLEIGALVENGSIGPRIALYDSHDESGDGIGPSFESLAALEAHVREERELRNLDRRGTLAVLHAMLSDPLAHQDSRHIGALCAKGWLRDFRNGNVTPEGVAALDAAGFPVTEAQRRNCAVLRLGAETFRLADGARPAAGTRVALRLEASGKIAVQDGERTLGLIWDSHVLRQALSEGHAVGGRVSVVWERHAGIVLDVSA